MMPDFPIPDPGPFGWATLGAILLKAIDLFLKARQVDTPEDRRTDAVMGDAAAIRAELRSAESGLRAALDAQEDRHTVKIASLQAAIDEERRRRFQAEDDLAATRADLAATKRRLDDALADLADLKGIA